ncbi:hypothetical protein MUN82_08995 [Hymenobacter aerilatus]|uniref:Uncharacterized protein n=1 Tax=Hymenobacter aerilatus TaxID=2932251 RepID=A0A8T9T3P3_9BACT|nr:hypothetical protein [Hymenobacter aerilatus]UOR07220.1 hypothetical protein MUN82_08995 [Hymenobacter aerilatus]
MANRKKPGKEAFKKELLEFSSDIPQAYTTRTLEKLAENGKLGAIVAQMREKGTYTPQALKIYINNVRLGRIVDWNVLDALRDLAKEAVNLEAELAA